MTSVNCNFNDATGCFGIKIRSDAAELRTMIIARFVKELNLSRE